MYDLFFSSFRHENFVGFKSNFCFFFLPQRIQLLYRPSLSGTSSSSHYSASDGIDRPSLSIPATISLEPPTVVDDAPPKYTPPPSYTTATGARLAKMLRNSIRRSVRRYLIYVLNLFKCTRTRNF